MIFRRSLVREMTTTAVGLFLVLLGILFTNLVLKLLARAAGGTVAPEGVLTLLGFGAMFYFNVLLSVTLFLTVLLTLTRWYRDSEMIVWFTSGQSLAQWVRPILWFAAPFLVAILVLSLFLSPWADRRRHEYERQLESRDEIGLITPGLFREFRSAHLVVFIESINTFDGTIRNVFLHSIDDEKDSTTVARVARLQEGPDGARYVVLEDGRRYDGTRGRPDFRLMEFERYGLRLEPRGPTLSDQRAKVKPTLELIGDRTPRNLGELSWRISLPVSALLMALLAIPLSAMNPRVGRSINLLLALLAYVTYSNLISLVQAWIAGGRLSFGIGAWILHLAVLGLAALLFWRRMTLPRWSLRRLVLRA